MSQLEANVKHSDAIIDNRTRYLCRIMWKLVQVSKDYRDLLLAHHQLQDDLRSTQRRKKKMHMQAVVRIVTLQLQMTRLRHDSATAQQQLEFYRVQHLTTSIPDDLPPIKEDKEDTEQEDENQMETIPYQEDEMDSDDEETANPPNRPTYDTTVPLPYDRNAPPPNNGTPAATKALFRVAQDALTEFFANLPNNLWGGAAAITEEETTEPTQSEPPIALPIPEPATAKVVPITPLQASPTITALSILAYGNPPPSIPTKGQTKTGPDSTSRTSLHLFITSDSKDKYDGNSEASDTAEDEAAALDGALLEEDKTKDDDGY